MCAIFASLKSTEYRREAVLSSQTAGPMNFTSKFTHKSLTGPKFI